MIEFQEKVYGFICKWKLDHDGVSPSLGQIAEGLGHKTRSKVQWACKGLVDDGHIQIEEGKIQLPIGRWIAQGELKDQEHFTWQDTDGPLSERVERAILAYYKMFTDYPSVVLMNPLDLEYQTSILVDSIVVVPVQPSAVVKLRDMFKMPLKGRVE